MITQINNLPSNMVGFRASGEVTASDFKTTVLPLVQKLVRETGELNYMLVLDTSVKKFTVGAWVNDALMGVQHLLRWNRAAIVSDEEGVKTFTDLFSKLMPGEFKGFDHADEKAAISWVSGRN